MKLQELIREIRHWRGDVLIGLPGKGGLVFIKVVKSDILRALEMEKNWGSQPPFQFTIVNGVGLLQYEGFRSPAKTKVHKRVA